MGQLRGSLGLMASEYFIVNPSDYLCFHGIRIKKVFNPTGVSWSAYCGTSIFSKNAKAFVMDEMPSNRDREYFEDKRFKEPLEAVEEVLRNSESVREQFLHIEVRDYIKNSLQSLQEKLREDAPLASNSENLLAMEVSRLTKVVEDCEFLLMRASPNPLAINEDEYWDKFERLFPSEEE